MVFAQNPYRTIPWTQVVNTPNPRRPFPEVGQVLMRRIENNPNNAERVEFLEREVPLSICNYAANLRCKIAFKLSL